MEQTPDRAAPPARDQVRTWMPSWMRRRARNVRARPLLVAALAGAAFLVALIALVIVPRRAQRAAREFAAVTASRPDTAAINRAVAEATSRLHEVDAALTAARAALQRGGPAAAPDTLPPGLRARRDSLTAASANLGRLLRRARAAPLADSYRALGESPELRKMPRVAQLLDSLKEVERTRAELGAAGGVDPIFVALTSRASEIGKRIEEIATQKRTALRRELDALAPPVPRASTPVADTSRLAAARDSAADALAAAQRRLAGAQRVNRILDERAAREQEAAAVGASAPAMLGAAAVLGLMAGFAIALLLEIRSPHVADASEAERITGARVLATVRPRPPTPERARRRADREVSPLIDQVSDAYHLLYTQLAAPSFKLPLVVVVGDAPAVTATVAANLAAAISRHARSTLLVDTDFETHSVASVMRLRAMPGLADVLTRRLTWPEAIVSALVGRERTIDVLTSGTPARAEALHAAAEEFNRELTHLARRFDTVVVSAPSSRRGTTPAFVSSVGPVVVCVRVARTKIATLRQLVAALEAHGAAVRGLLLWAVDDPVLSLPPDADAMLSRPPAAARAAAGEDSTAERPASLG